MCCERESVSPFSPVRLSETPWDVAHQVPLSMEFSRQEYRSGLPFPSPRDLPSPGIKPRSPALRADSLPFGVGKIPWRRKCNPVQSSCLENTMDRGARWATVHGVPPKVGHDHDWTDDEIKRLPSTGASVLCILGFGICYPGGSKGKE